MPAALEAVDLAVLCAEVLAWALLTVTVVLLAKLVSVLGHEIDLGIVKFRPLGWLSDALRSYVLAGAEDARKAVAGAMRATFDGLTWGLDATFRIFHDLATKARDAITYLWGSVVKPFVNDVVNPVRKVALATEAKVATLTTDVQRELGRDAAKVGGLVGAAIEAARTFTRTEVTAARRDLTAAIGKVDSYIHAAETGAVAIPGTVEADFGDLWNELRKYIRPKDLEQLLAAGLLSGMLLRTIAQAAGLDSAECQAKHKQICGVDPARWANLLEGLAALALAFDFRELVAFAESLAGDVKPLVLAAK